MKKRSLLIHKNEHGESITIEFVPQDFWVGAFWKHDSYESWHRRGIDNPALPAIGHSFDLYVCIIPCFPIHYSYHWR